MSTTLGSALEIPVPMIQTQTFFSFVSGMGISMIPEASAGGRGGLFCGTLYSPALD